MSVMTLNALEPMPRGVDAWADQLRGWWRRRPHYKRALQDQVKGVEREAQALVALDADELAQRMAQAMAAVRRDPVAARGQLCMALAVVCEMAYRSKGMRPYPVQLMGALALHHGWLAEMATGEGKTLTVALAAVLAAWSGRPCHVVTANEYLAQRDAESMQLLYDACGVEVASALGDDSPEQRQPAYGADVCYVTAKTFLADYLRDELATRQGHGAKQEAFVRWCGGAGQSALMLKRGLHTAIVDEADSVLIDEAVTPLILSAPREVPGMHDAVRWAHALAQGLVEGVDYRGQQRDQRIELGAGAEAAVQRSVQGLPVGWQSERQGRELLQHALTVRSLYKRQQHYLVHEDKVVLLDEFTGRMMPERSLTAGLHQAIEAHEGLEMTHPNESMGQMSFQSFFRRMPRLSGTTGTGSEARAELWRIYQLGVIKIPTHRPRQTRMQGSLVCFSEDDKWQTVAQHVLEVNRRGQPVLIGVRSVRSSEALNEHLLALGLAPQVLNAQAHAQEAEIIAQAGQVGCVTIATNMAGRGTDIHVQAEALDLGGLHVVIAEPNDSARVDRQLAGRCGRQGEPGSVSAVLSAEEVLFKRYLQPWQRRVLRQLAQARAKSAWHRGLQSVADAVVRAAQNRAEADAFNRRWSVLRADEWLERALPFDDTHRY